MADVYDTNFSGQVPVTGVVSAAAKTEIDANIDRIGALLGTLTGNPEYLQAASPDFDEIHPDTRRKLLNEYTELKAAIAAAPEA